MTHGSNAQNPPSGPFERLKNSFLQRIYRGSTFVACWEERLADGAIAPTSDSSWDAAAAKMLDHIIHVSSGDSHGLTKIENRWTLVKKRAPSGDVASLPVAVERIPIDVSH